MRKVARYVLEGLPAGLLALFFFLASVKPQDARLNLAEWAMFVHIEAWPVWLTDRRAMVIATLLVVLFYLWLYRKKQKAKEPSTRIVSPIVSLVVERDKSIWFVLRLVNGGPVAEFRAEIRIVDTNARFHPGDVRSPLWFESARSLTVRILSGGSEWIRIARSDVFTLFRHEPHYSESAFFLDSDNFNSFPQWVEFEVTVLREPPFDDGPCIARFRYAKSEWNSPTLEAVVP